MSRKSIRKAGPELVTEKAISFQKEENGLFRRVETVTQRDIHTSLITKTDTIESDALYRQTLEDDFDHEIVFENIDGTQMSIRLKQVDPENWKN